MTHNIYILFLFCLCSLGNLQAQLSLSGQFLTQNGNDAGNVDIELRDANGNTVSTQHVGCGSTYIITGLEAGAEYSIHLSKDTSTPLNGLSTLDLVFISKGILGIQPLSELSALAADGDGDGLVTVMDLIILRRLILGIIASFSDGENWIFVKEGNNDASTSYDIQLSESVTDYNFIVLKRGDVSGNHIECE